MGRRSQGWTPRKGAPLSAGAEAKAPPGTEADPAGAELCLEGVTYLHLLCQRRGQ